MKKANMYHWPCPFRLWNQSRCTCGAASIAGLPLFLRFLVAAASSTSTSRSTSVKSWLRFRLAGGFTLLALVLRTSSVFWAKVPSCSNGSPDSSSWSLTSRTVLKKNRQKRISQRFQKKGLLHNSFTMTSENWTTLHQHCIDYLNFSCRSLSSILNPSCRSLSSLLILSYISFTRLSQKEEKLLPSPGDSQVDSSSKSGVPINREQNSIFKNKLTSALS